MTIDKKTGKGRETSNVITSIKPRTEVLKNREFNFRHPIQKTEAGVEFTDKNYVVVDEWYVTPQPDNSFKREESNRIVEIFFGGRHEHQPLVFVTKAKEWSALDRQTRIAIAVFINEYGDVMRQVHKEPDHLKKSYLWNSLLSDIKNRLLNMIDKVEESDAKNG